MQLDLKHCGFTLLELLVALAIFAVIAVMAYSGLNVTLSAYSQADAYATQLAHLQVTFSRLGRDIQQFTNRPIRNEYGDMVPAMQGTESTIAFTCAGWRNPAQQPRASLQRVAYYMEEQVLWRAYWHVLDRTQNSQVLRVALLENVEAFNLRFLGQDLQWYETWPLSPSIQTNLVAVEVTLSITNWGSLRWLLEVVDSEVAPTAQL